MVHWIRWTKHDDEFCCSKNFLVEKLLDPIEWLFFSQINVIETFIFCFIENVWIFVIEYRTNLSKSSRSVFLIGWAKWKLVIIISFNWIQLDLFVDVWHRTSSNLKQLMSNGRKITKINCGIVSTGFVSI